MAKRKNLKSTPLDLRTLQWVDTITETIISMIKIECPDDCGIDWNRVIEWGLSDNCLLMFNDPKTGDTVTKFAPVDIDIYQNPTAGKPVFPNGKDIPDFGEKEIGKDAVILWFNPRHRRDFTSWLERIRYTAHMLAVIDETISLNADLQKTPVIAFCDPANALEIENFFNQFEEFKRVCTVTKKADSLVNDIQLIDLKGSYVADKLKDLENCILFDLLSLVGVNNSNVDKSQYVGSFEINANNEYLFIRKQTLIGELNACLEKYNKLFSTSYKASSIFDEKQEQDKQAQLEQMKNNGFGDDKKVGDGDDEND